MSMSKEKQLEWIIGSSVYSFGGEIDDYDLILTLKKKLPAQENFHKERVIDSVKWLVEQAERTQKLEDVIYQDARQGVIESMYEENKQLREALEFYADSANYDSWEQRSFYGDEPIHNVDMDHGDKARQALELKQQ